MLPVRRSSVVSILAFAVAFCGCDERPSQQAAAPAPQASPTKKAASPDLKRATADAESRLRELLIERKQILEMMVRTAEARMETGGADYEEIRKLKKDLLYAELDLCSTPAERIVVREKIVQLAKEQEDYARDLVAVGKLSKIGAAKARLPRLEAEIGLLREKLAVKSQRKK